MSLYSGNTATEASTGSNYQVGLYKCMATAPKMTDWGALSYELKSKFDEDGSEGPKAFDSLKFQSNSEAMKAEIDRRLTVMLGKPEIDKPEDLEGKVFYVVFRKGPKYLEPMPFGGYFDKNKKSATGNPDSIHKAIEQAKAYDYTQDDYVMSKLQQSQGHLASVDSSSDDTPF